jgi:hypothetical protein
VLVDYCHSSQHHNVLFGSQHGLGIVELREMILLRIPIHDLLLVQRVCRQWQAVIRTSRALRQALFLEPITTHLAYCMDEREQEYLMKDYEEQTVRRQCYTTETWYKPVLR